VRAAGQRCLSTDVRAAQTAVDRLFPTAEEMDSGVENERTTPWRSTFDAHWPEFPYRSTSLNRITFHPVVLAMAKSFLGTSDVRLYMSLLTAKYANQSSGYNQLLHADFPNHTILVPQLHERFPQLELFIYLTDVSEANGATRMVSRRRSADIAVERHTLPFTEYAALYDDPGIANGLAGTIVAYRPEVYHRSADVTTPGARRIMMHVSYRPAGRRVGPVPGVGVQGLLARVAQFRSGERPDRARPRRVPPARPRLLGR